VLHASGALARANLLKPEQLKKKSRHRVLKTYKVALGGDPVGPKAKTGDKKSSM
jgi:murein L,D-transpeptidase YafK